MARRALALDRPQEHMHQALGNAYAEQGDLGSAIGCYHDLIAHAEAAKNDLSEVIGHNAARPLAERGLALAAQHDLPLATPSARSAPGSPAYGTR